MNTTDSSSSPQENLHLIENHCPIADHILASQIQPNQENLSKEQPSNPSNQHSFETKERSSKSNPLYFIGLNSLILNLMPLSNLFSRVEYQLITLIFFNLMIYLALFQWTPIVSFFKASSKALGNRLNKSKVKIEKKKAIIITVMKVLSIMVLASLLFDMNNRIQYLEKNNSQQSFIQNNQKQMNQQIKFLIYLQKNIEYLTNSSHSNRVEDYQRQAALSHQLQQLQELQESQLKEINSLKQQLNVKDINNKSDKLPNPPQQKEQAKNVLDQSKSIPKQQDQCPHPSAQPKQQKEEQNQHQPEEKHFMNDERLNFLNEKLKIFSDILLL